MRTSAGVLCIANKLPLSPSCSPPLLCAVPSFLPLSLYPFLPLSPHVPLSPVSPSSIHTIQGILSFLSAPLIGALSDAWGRKSFLLLSVFMTCLPIPSFSLVLCETWGGREGERGRGGRVEKEGERGREGGREGKVQAAHEKYMYMYIHVGLEITVFSSQSLFCGCCNLRNIRRYILNCVCIRCRLHQ